MFICFEELALVQLVERREASHAACLLATPSYKKWMRVGQEPPSQGRFNWATDASVRSLLLNKQCLNAFPGADKS